VLILPVRISTRQSPPIAKEEPLMAEINEFLRAVASAPAGGLSGRRPPRPSCRSRHLAEIQKHSKRLNLVGQTVRTEPLATISAPYLLPPHPVSNGTLIQ